jgi:hypothetical protein
LRSWTMKKTYQRRALPVQVGAVLACLAIILLFAAFSWQLIGVPMKLTLALAAVIFSNYLAWLLSAVSGPDHHNLPLKDLSLANLPG